MKRVGLLPLVLLAACSGSSGVPTVSSAPSPSPTPEPSVQGAGALARALQQAGAPIDRIVVFTAASDPNHLLGRPKGYVSKAAWQDPRVARSDLLGTERGSIDRGGGIEVFDSRTKAAARGQYIEAIGPPIANEYDWVCGTALLRITGNLTPTQAKVYPRLLRRVLDTSCSAVT